MSKRTKKQLSFNKEINTLLYALGDVQKPAVDTVRTLDEILISYLTDVSLEAYRAATCADRNKLKLEDFKFALRKDPVKLARLNELHALDKAHQQLMKEINYQPEKQVLELQENENDADDHDLDDDQDHETSKNDIPSQDAVEDNTTIKPGQPAGEPVRKKRKYTRRKPKPEKANTENKT